jgi:hypothetical protein
MELTKGQEKMAHAAGTSALAAQNDRLREIINNALVELMNYEDRPTSFVLRDAIKELRRA